MNPSKHYADEIPTPLGVLWAVVDERGALVRLDFAGGRHAPRGRRALEREYRASGIEIEWRPSACAPVARALKRYFTGRATSFDLPVAPRGSAFQQRVWAELRRVPYGETVSYGELARRIGRSGAARAVGRANATNPISVVIPCHRVVGSDGALTGYGGGMERKRALLRLEGVGA